MEPTSHDAAGGAVHESAFVDATARIAASAVVGPHATVLEHVTLGASAHIGAAATVRAGLNVGDHARVEAGSVVTRDVPMHTIVDGNPAQITGYVDAAPTHEYGTRVNAGPTPRFVHESEVDGVTVHRFPVVHDMRGDLVVGEFHQFVPFTPQRFFVIHNVPDAEIRGEHAHVECHQFLICLAGRVRVLADDGTTRQEFVLDEVSQGLHLPPMTWAAQFGYTPDAVLMVFASHRYDNADYIRAYDEFLEQRRAFDEVHA